MSWPMIRYVLSAVKREVVAGILIVVLLTILQHNPMRPAMNRVDPFRPTAQWLLIFMGLVGALLPIRILHESTGVHAWLKSRGFRREAQCLAQLVTGALILAFMTLVAAAIQVLGIRQFVQLAFGSAWFPMVRWYELLSIPYIFAFSWCLYGFSFLLVTAAKAQGSLFPNMRITMAAMAALATLIVSQTTWNRISEYCQLHNQMTGVVLLVFFGAVCSTLAVGVCCRQEEHGV